MSEIKVNMLKTIDDSYSIVVDKGILSNAAFYCIKAVNVSRFVIITDTNVAKFYLKIVEDSFIKAGKKVLSYIYKAGEKYKNRKTKEEIEDFLLENKVDRTSCIITLGGGVTGDMGGFVAATFLRGLPFIQIPTTLLSQVDQSIGGKVAVDTPYAKNMIGAFYQPKLVLIDTDTLKTMPAEISLNGIGEVIKHSIISDAQLFEYLISNKENICKCDDGAMQFIVKRNCEIKRRVVEIDEKEMNIRKTLNFGHTLGHSIETLSDYKISHDECVIIGMYYESLAANEAGYLSEVDLQKIIKLLKEYMPLIKIPETVKTEDIIKKTYSDKKVKDGRVKYAIPVKIGEAKYDVEINESILLNVLNHY